MKPYSPEWFVHLIAETSNNPHRKEILRLSLEQAEDDLRMGANMPKGAQIQ